MRKKEFSRLIEKTDDGSATLFVPELDEHYHSTKGARTESQHIFVDMGLKACTALSPQILEVGFGTGSTHGSPSKKPKEAKGKCVTPEWSCTRWRGKQWNNCIMWRELPTL